MATASNNFDPRNLAVGGVLHMMEAATLGMPLEVWKTRNGAYSKETAAESFRAVYANGGARSFWRGINAKLMEAAAKGAVLVFAKNIILNGCEATGMGRTGFVPGSIAGAGGGVAQTVVMSPLTYVVTFAMKKPDAMQKLGTFGVLREAGLRGCYSSAPAMAMRQASNWGLRQGFNDLIVGQARKSVGGRELSVGEKMVAGVLGGACACINQPVEVLRIRVQSEHVAGNTSLSTAGTARLVMKESGILGFYAGIIPRIGLSAWQTLFMVTFADMVTAQLKKK